MRSLGSLHFNALFNSAFPRQTLRSFAFPARMYNYLIMTSNTFINMARHKHAYNIDPFEILWISPSEITEHTCETENISRVNWKKMGLVEAGDWDQSTGEFTELESYKSIYAHFVNRIEWEDTTFFQTNIRLIHEGYIRWGCSTELQYKQRCKELDDLYSQIKKDGYRSQRDLYTRSSREKILSHSNFFKHQHILDEVVVCVTRSGKFVFSHGGGEHRLSIAKILQIERIPVRVLVRHAEWQELRDTLAVLVNRGLRDNLEQQLSHPDLHRIKSQ